MFAPQEFFDLSSWPHLELFAEDKPVWEVLRLLKTYISDLLKPNVAEIASLGPMLAKTVVLYQDELIDRDFQLIPGDATKKTFRVIHGGRELSGATVLYAGCCLMDSNISLGPGVVVEPGALIKGPAIIGAHCEVRQGAYLRGHCLVGDGCVVGHTTEMKHAVMLHGAKAGHFAYIGDSILGSSTNLGAGTKLANLKIIDTPVTVRFAGETYDTGLRKFGAIIGDNSETGCNSVTNPGTLLGPRCLVYPGVSVKSGYYRRRSIIR
ncbi:MAG: glucose-1-phosphate thymidylyltransferase [Deltaproteobacteria bacterium]|nr:glucose-1-phosphate thymidylyltransferase [Deltaproteobacteria bacterium]